MEGDNSIVVREVDAAGNVSGETSLDFVLDTQAPNAPTITLDTDSGISNGDLLTNDGSFTVTPSEAGNTVEYQAADGSWSTTPPAVVEGNNSIVVRETDAAGNVSGETSLDFVLDTQAPNAPTITLDTDSGMLGDDLLTNDGSFTVTPSEAGNTVEYQAADGSWSTTPPAVVEGDNSIVVREVDAAGNASGETSLDFVLDTQAPNAPTITLDTDSGISNGDLLTNDGSFTVTPSEAGNTVEYQAADGSWSTTPPAVVEGNNSIVVREVDAAGNVSGETSLDFVLDTQVPNAPTITLDTDSGISDGDLLTNDGSFTVTPSEAGNTVEYQAADGSWSTTPPAVVEGDNSIVVREVDAAGNASGETSLDFVLDTQAPNAPTITLDTDSGMLGDDLLTNDGSFTVTPSEAGNTVEYQAADGSWSTTPPAVVEGDNSIVVRETDAAGNVSGETSLDFVLDTQAPNAPTITLDTDSGMLGDDLLTNDGSFTVTPSEAGNTVEYQAADGSWSTTPPAVVEGNNSIVVREVDAAGNASDETSLDFVLDTQVPNAPTITLDTDSGIINGDLLTNDGSFTVTPSEAGNTVEYFVDGEWTTGAPMATEGDNSIVVREVDAAGNTSGETSLDFVLDTQVPNAPTITLDTDSGISNGDLLTNDGSFTVTPSEAGNTVEYQAADGSWSTTPPAVVEGNNSIVVREVDAAGNTSGETSLDFVLDTQVPNAPTITLDTDSGISNGDLLTNDGSFTVTPSEAGNTVEYQAADGSWSTTPPAVVEGNNSIVVREVDAAGNASGETSLDFVLDTQVPNAPTITLDTDSGISNGDLLTNDGSFTVTPSEAGNTVEYQAADGSWSTTPPAVVEGNNSIVVREVDAAGNASGETSLDFVLDTQAPNAPTITLDTDSGISDGDLLTNDGSFTVTPSEAGNTVEYQAADGSWSTTPPAVVEGNNSIVVREVDAAGNASGETSLDFVLDTQAPNAPTITDITDDSVNSDYSKITVHGSGEPGATITLYSQGNVWATTVVGEDGTWSVDYSGIPDSSDQILQVEQTDLSGNTSELSDPIQYFNSDYYGNSLDSDDYGFLGDGDDFFQAHNDDANDRVMFDGGAGNDTISFDSAFSDVQISINSDGDIVLVDREGDTNILRDFENFEFTDTTKTIEELTVPKVTIIDDANNDGILTKTELEGRITAVISIPSIAVAGMALLITIDGHTEEYILSEEDISSGVIVKEIDTPENNTEVNVSVDISYNGSVYSGEDSVIYVGNNEPTASNDIVNVLENNSILISKDMLLSNDIDADGDSLSIINIGSVNGGVASLDEHGNILFTPDLNFSGEVVFEYTIDDGYGGQSTAEITVNIDAVANTPNLIVENSDWSLSTGLENVDIPGPAPWYVAGLDGWRPSDGEPVIEIWVTGESMGYGATEGNGSIIVNPSEGNTIVELNKVENNEFSSAGGIQRDISTVEGKLYTISLDAAPRPGLEKNLMLLRY
ncbi:Ig-like domain-containing protein [Aliivibrio fischeri]